MEEKFLQKKIVKAKSLNEEFLLRGIIKGENCGFNRPTYTNAEHRINGQQKSGSLINDPDRASVVPTGIEPVSKV